MPTITKEELSNLEEQAGLNLNNASFYYSFIETNHRISGNSPIYSDVIINVNDSDDNLFLVKANKHNNLENKVGFTSTIKSSLIDTELYSDATSSFINFREKQFEEFIEDIIQEIDDLFDEDELEEILRDLSLELFYKIEITETINKYEFNDLLNKSNIYLKPNDLDNLFKTFDRNDNDEIDYNELMIFIEYIKNLKKRRKKKNFKNNYNITDVINIDTRFRNNYYDTLSTDFTYILPEIQNNVKKISIGSIEMPMTHYNVSSKLKNNTMLIISDSNNITITKDISSSWNFKSQIGCLSGEFEYGGFIFDDENNKVIYDTSTIIVSESTIGVSAELYNNKWWDGPAVQTINTWDTSITPIEFVTFNNKDSPTGDSNTVVTVSYETQKQNYYSDLNVLIEQEDSVVSLPGLGNVTSDEFKSIYLNTRFIPFSYYLENTNLKVDIKNSIYSQYIIENLYSNNNINSTTVGTGKLIADTYSSSYYVPPQQRINNSKRRIDISDNKNLDNNTSKQGINYFPLSIFKETGGLYPEDSSGNIIWGWSAQNKTNNEFYNYFNNQISYNKASVTTNDEITNCQTDISNRYYSKNFEQYLDSSSVDLLKYYYVKSDFNMDPSWCNWCDMNNVNNFLQKEFISHNDLSFGNNFIKIIEVSNVEINNFKKTTTLNTTTITNYDTLNREILVEATPSLLELSNNDISKSFINAIDGWFNDSSGGGYNDNGMREEFSYFKADIIVDASGGYDLIFPYDFTNEDEAKNHIRSMSMNNSIEEYGYRYNINEDPPKYEVYSKSQLQELHAVIISDISSRLVTYNKYKPLTKYTLYDTFTWDEHNLDISNQKVGINSKHKINNYFLQGSPNRTDICWNTITYVNGDPIEYPYDSSHNIETYKKTSVEEDIHVKYYDYYDLKSGKDLLNFTPVRFAWLATLPDGNYDETWKSTSKIFDVENIVNDSISNAIPGAIDIGGNFAAIKKNKLKWYNWLNNYKDKNNIINNNSRLFDKRPDKLNKMFAMSALNLKDIQFSVDKNTGRSIFATKTNIINSNNINYEVDSVITKVDTFTKRIGHTPLRTFETLPPENSATFQEYQDLSLSKPTGQITPEIALLISKAKEPTIVSYPNFKNKKMIYSVRFNVDEYGNTDLETNIQLKLGWVLGFRGAEYILGDINNNIIYNPNSPYYTPPIVNVNVNVNNYQFGLLSTTGNFTIHGSLSNITPLRSTYYNFNEVNLAVDNAIFSFGIEYQFNVDGYIVGVGIDNISDGKFSIYKTGISDNPLVTVDVFKSEKTENDKVKFKYVTLNNPIYVTAGSKYRTSYLPVIINSEITYSITNNKPLSQYTTGNITITDSFYIMPSTLPSHPEYPTISSISEEVIYGVTDIIFLAES